MSNETSHHSKSFWAERRKAILRFLRTCAINHYCYGADKLPERIIERLKTEVKSSRPRELQVALDQFRAEVDRLNPGHVRE